MLRGIYTAASGMIAQAMAENILANNLANEGTPGFKRSQAAVGAFPWQRVYLGGNRATTLASVGTGTLLDRTSLDWTEGNLRAGGALDVALAGPGFFRVSSSNGQVYVRSGRFQVSQAGLLTDSAGRPVEGASGLIRLNTAGAPARIDAEGRVYQGTSEVGRLAVYTPANGTHVTALANGAFRLDGAVSRENSPKFIPGMIESSNVDPVTAMTQLMAVARTYQASTRAFTAEDQAAQQAISEVGKF